MPTRWFHVAAALLLGFSGTAVADPDPKLGGPDPGALAEEVFRLFHSRCSQCHSPTSTRKKATRKWSDSADLGELRTRHVEVDGRVPEDIRETDLWFILREGLMPPPKSPVPPLSEAEIQTVRQWLESGAPTDVSPDVRAEVEAALLDTDAPHSSQSPEARDRGFLNHLLGWLGGFHPVVVHFPVGLLLAAALAELLSILTRWDGLRSAARFCLILGALGAAAAAPLGWFDAMFDDRGGLPLFLHRWLGVSAAVLAAGAVLLNEIDRRAASPTARLLFRVVLFLNGAVVAAAGHFGGVLVHGPEYYQW